MSTHPSPLQRLVQAGNLDVTSTDPHEIGRFWGVEVVGTRNGLLAIPVKRPCVLRLDSGGVEVGAPGDVLVVHNQKMVRRIVPGDLFEFLFGEKLT